MVKARERGAEQRHLQRVEPLLPDANLKPDQGGAIT
jgi:hypothetical protein